MPTKCIKCGLVSEVNRAFQKVQTSVNPTVVDHYCPDCWSKRDIKRGLESLALYTVGLLMACIWVVGEPTEPTGWAFLNFLLFPLFVISTVLPHELGHSIAASLLGAQVLTVRIGRGKKLFNLSLPGQTISFHLIPLGGYTMFGQRDKMWFRTKHFLVVSAGPLANIAMAMIAWLYLPYDDLLNWHIDRGLAPIQMFMLANLITAILNFWPSTIHNELGKVHSDGRSLARVFSINQKRIHRSNVLYHVGKAVACSRRKKYREAQTWLENGLERFPENPTLLLYLGVNLIHLRQFGAARDTTLTLLSRTDLTPEARYTLSNNLAYADILIADPALLEEADHFSTEAMNNLSWKPYVNGTRGSVLVELGRIEEGIQLLQSAVRNGETKESKALNLCWLAMAEIKRGNTAESKKHIEAARHLNPDCFLIERASRLIADSVSAVSEKIGRA